MSEELFVNIHGLARHLQLPRAWLEAEATEGRIPSLQIGNHRRFNVSAVKHALAARAAAAPLCGEEGSGGES